MKKGPTIEWDPELPFLSEWSRFYEAMRRIAVELQDILDTAISLKLSLATFTTGLVLAEFRWQGTTLAQIYLTDSADQRWKARTDPRNPWRQLQPEQSLWADLFRPAIITMIGEERRDLKFTRDHLPHIALPY